MTTEYAGSGNVHRSMELLWELRDRPTRGPKPGLSLGKIVTAAVRVADAEGLAALSMRRVAAELGVGTMSLYRYVPGKSELLDLMLDQVIEIPEGPPDGENPGWRDYLEQDARHHWQLCMKHPWFAFVDQSRPVLGPNGLKSVEYVTTGMKSTGLSDQQIMMMISALSTFVEATARVYLSEKQAEERTGISNEEYWSAQEPVLVTAMESGRFPVMAQLSENTFSFTHEQVFEFTLTCLLDGFAVVIDGQAAPAGDAAG